MHTQFAPIETVDTKGLEGLEGQVCGPPELEGVDRHPAESDSTCDGKEVAYHRPYRAC